MPLVRSSPSLLYPGMPAPVTGIYKAIHRGHRGNHFVTAIKGDEFPTCRKCRDDVAFELWVEAEYITQDWDFAGPRLQRIK